MPSFSCSSIPPRPLTSIVTLTLGIGATAAIFSLLNAVVLRPLPVSHPEQLVALATTIADDKNGGQPFSLQMFNEIRRRQRVFSDVFAWSAGGIRTFEAGRERHSAVIAAASGNYYSALGLKPLLGRYITDADVALESGTSAAVAVISYRAWRTWFHGSSRVIGQPLRIGDGLFTVIGVEPEEFSGLVIDAASDVTVPIYVFGQSNSREPRLLSLRLFARLKPGINVKQAGTSLAVLWPRVQEAAIPPGYEGERRSRFFARRITLEPAGNGKSSLRKRFAGALNVLLALVGAVVFMACLNIATLGLARSTSRAHEYGVRAALGARQLDLTRQPLLEAAIASFLGCAAGLCLAPWASRAVLHLAWTDLVATPLNTSIDTRVLLFTIVVTVGVALVAAAAPAWTASRTDALKALQRQSRTIRGSSLRLSRALLALQIAFSLVLAIGSLLFTRTLAGLYNADLGYRRDHLLTLVLFTQGKAIRPEEMPAYGQQLVKAVERIPGVARASFSAYGPANEIEWLRPVAAAAHADFIQVVADYVSPGFFSVTGIRMVAGREFEWSDFKPDANAAIISRSLAERLFGHENPVGRSLFQGPRSYLETLRVVGVAEDASLWRVESRRPLAIFRPHDYDSEPMLEVHTFGEPRAMKASVERAVESLGRHYSLRTATVDERLSSFLSIQRLMAFLSTFFAVLALLIAAIGLFGLLSFSIARRRAELAVRIALGARPKQVTALLAREVLLIVAAGCALGFPAALLLRRFVESQLFGITALDPVSWLMAPSVLLLTSVLAAVVPAVRAIRVNPVEAMRAE